MVVFTLISCEFKAIFLVCGSYHVKMSMTNTVQQVRAINYISMS